MKRNRKLPLIEIFTAFFLALGTVAQEQKPAGTLLELQRRLNDHITQPRFAAAMWGVKVVSRETGKTLFEHNSQKLFSPASNSKLYTVALALDRLGADYRIKTSLYSASKPDQSGVLQGDLVVYGRGDPTINARLHNGDIYQALEPLVSALTNAGVRTITGDLVADESHFHGPPFGSGWAWDDLENSYGAEISALTINDNTLQVTVKPGDRAGAPGKLAVSPETSWLIFSNHTETVAKGGRRNVNFYRPLNEHLVYISGQVPLDDAGYTEDLTIPNPPGLFIALLQSAMIRHGIKVQGKLRTMNWLDREADPIAFDHLTEFGGMESLPMRDIAREVQKPSQNLYADLLLAQVGEKTRAAGAGRDQTSEELGVRELNKFLAEAGVKKGDVLFEEGSGLSRNNLTTPNATVALLQFMSRHKSAEVYLNSLPIAGVDGTLRSRMKGTPAAGNVRAKTGTLRWANSLSGHVTTAAGEHLIFSIMLNRYYSPEPNRSGRAEVDPIAVMLAGFTGKTGD